jgi:hypothetical protein
LSPVPARNESPQSAGSTSPHESPARKKKKETVNVEGVENAVSPLETEEDFMSTETHLSPSPANSPSCSTPAKSVYKENQNIQQYEDDDEDPNLYCEVAAVSVNSPSKRYWCDPGKESELCRLWEEEVNLYDLSHPEHRNPLARRASLRRIAAALGIPCEFR